MAYELRLTKEQKKRFVAVAKKRLKERGMQYSNLAEAIDYSCGSVKEFLSEKNEKRNRFIAAQIANELKIKKEDYK